MKKKIYGVASLVLWQSMGVLASFSTPEVSTTVTGVRHPVNFKGSLATHQGNMYSSIDNISINKKYKNILVIDKPMLNTLAKPVKNEKTHGMEILLEKDPYKEYTETHIDLSETKKIEALDSPVYVYRPDSKHRSIELIEIKVYSNDRTQTMHSYLIDHNAKVHFDEVNDAGPIQKDTPIAAVKELIIKEYAAQDGLASGAVASQVEPKKNK